MLAKPSSRGQLTYGEVLARGVAGQLGGPVNQLCLIEGFAAGPDPFVKGADATSRVLTVDRVDGKPLSQPVIFADCWYASPAARPAVGARFSLMAAETAATRAEPDDPNHLLQSLADRHAPALDLQSRVGGPAFYTDLAVYGPAKPPAADGRHN